MHFFGCLKLYESRLFGYLFGWLKLYESCQQTPTIAPKKKMKGWRTAAAASGVMQLTKLNTSTARWHIAQALERLLH